MITQKTGNIIDEEVDALVNTVNCVGFMGRGIALQFKKAFPENNKLYVAACKRREVQPGRMFVFQTSRIAPRYIINFPTKRHWRGKSRMEDIDAGLVALVEEIRARDIRSIAIPPLGSGLGGLDWSEVRPRIEKALREFSELKVVIFEPHDTLADKQINRSRDVPKRTPGRAVLVCLMHRYLCGLLDPFMTLLEVHKLMYFMQAAGEPLKLTYQKEAFGPYSVNLRHVLNKVEGHLISGYADGGDSPNKQLELVPGALEEAEEFLADKTETLERFDRVSDLVDGFESSFGMELLSTVHWVASEEKGQSVEQIVKKTYAWNERKKCFSVRQIKLAIKVLSEKGWIANP